MTIKFLDLAFNANNGISDPDKAIFTYKHSFGYLDFIKQKVDASVILHIDYEGEKTYDGIKYSFFKGSKFFWYVPFYTLRYIKKLQPQFILVQGLIFPLQVMALRAMIGNKTKIIVQHHGELPASGIKRRLQKIADKLIDAYLFTAMGNAEMWYKKGNISKSVPCYEILEASSTFKKQDKVASKAKLGITGDTNFIWVGTLDANKDPITVLKGFSKYITETPGAKLYMVYSKDALLPLVKDMINNNPLLQNAVSLIGKVPHDELQDWFSACDYFIAASYKEGSGVSLIESMSCACIPVLTNIPPFRKITAQGRYGFLYENGNVDDLVETLRKLGSIDKQQLSQQILNYFTQELSFRAIADGIYDICKTMYTE